MVDKQRTRYVGGSDGAPPVPPAGGYQGARRIASAPDAAAGLPASGHDGRGGVTYTAPEPTARKGSNAMGLIAIVVAALFVLVLLLMMGAGGTDALYGATLLVLQLVVLGVVVAALLSRNGRMLGSIALAVTLVFNVATVGAMGALRSSATHAYDGTKSEEQKHEQAYPGIRDVSRGSILSQPSLEQTQAEGERLLTEIRTRLTAEFGFTWVESGTVDLTPERNGYGGESMLQRYQSPSWTTEQPVQDDARKRQVMDVISDVLADHGMWRLYALNEPGTTTLAPHLMAKLYGSEDPARQHTWEYYSDDYPDPLRFYAHVYDLSNDPTGEFLTQRQAVSDQTGAPLEGVQLTIIAHQLLSEDDREEFEQRMRDYPGF